jgi:phosphonoacetate hydrolase
MKPSSCLIVSFDGLRRDRATPDLMPNLAAFMAAGADCLHSRSVFPSETRVAVTSTVTGCAPAEHGLVANQFLHPAFPGRPFQTARHEDLSAAAALGQLIDRPGLGERLADAGRSLAVVSTASPGATWMMNPAARRLRQPVFSVYGPPVSTEPLHSAVLEALGPVPVAGVPNSARVDYAARVLTEIVYPRHEPDLCLLWLSDPDITSHAHGVTHRLTAEAQRACDEAFGTVVAWWRAGHGPENLIVMSDHGQITGTACLDPAEHLPQWSGRLSPGSFSGLYLDDRSKAAKEAAIATLTDMPWCGLIFAQGAEGEALEGALPWSLVRNGHPRGPDIGFTLRATAPSHGDGAATDACLFAAYIEPGGGMHGGLNRGELSTVLAWGGPAFRENHRSETPCWLPDIAPTILDVLGLPTEGTSGRVLREVRSNGGEAPCVEARMHSVSYRGHEQHLGYWRVGDRTIVDCGWTAGTGAWR